MSCQAGMWNFDGKPIDREFLGKLGASIVQYGPDGADAMGRGGPGEYIRGPFAMIYKPFHTNKESRLECQPYVSKRGNVMTWDGRLDNREELIRALSYQLETEHRGQRVDSRPFVDAQGRQLTVDREVASGEKVARDQWPVTSEEKNSQAEQARRGSSTAQADPFIENERGREQSACSAQNDSVGEGGAGGDVPPLHEPTSSQEVNWKEKASAHSGPFGNAQGKQNDSLGNGGSGGQETSQPSTTVRASWTYTDVAIVMAAWEAWGTECFKRLIGDFSLAVWEPNSRTLTLAKDFIGVRYLYYELLPEGVRGGARTDPELGDAEPPSGPCVWWCSRLEPLILLSGRQYEINEEYIAGYFAFHPANHITPYVGVDALPAGHYVQIHNGQKKLVQYWHFDPDKRITYKTDAEYEEHFRQVFFGSVKRRLRADAPLVAGLSGGRDSSAIVCVADELIARGEAECPQLDTYSRFTQDDPFQDDHKYLTIVEAKRSRVGHHLGKEKSVTQTPKDIITPALSGVEGIATEGSVSFRRLRPLSLDCFSAHPGVDQDGAEAIQKRMEFMQSNGYRVILAGIGGDEVTGGVPLCIPELADLLVQGRLIKLTKQLKAWSLVQQRTWADLLWNVLKNVAPIFMRKMVWHKKNAWPWIDSELVAGHNLTFTRNHGINLITSGLPSFRTNAEIVAGMSQQLAHTSKLHRRGEKYNCYDRGFPFLDRDFIEFLFAIPREQILRPGQYRSLMRRALRGIIPVEILNRTRKAFSARRPVVGIQSVIADLHDLFATPLSSDLRFVNHDLYLRAVDELANGKNNLVLPVRRTITLEIWLRSLNARRALKRQMLASENGKVILEGAA